MSEAIQATRLLRFDAASAEERLDEVAHEEPLELQLNGHAFAVLMRTPGHDEELGTGFALTEGIVRDVRELEAVQHCTVVASPDAEDNVLLLRTRTPVDVSRFRRSTFASSSCGVCGKGTIEQALRVAGRIETPTRVLREVLTTLPALLQAEQSCFARTGGLHAAALFDADGRRLTCREDVGRHNAVDKVIGWAARTGAPFNETVLLVSGRVSFELVQKTVAAGIPVLAGISAPTSLAVRMAQALGLTLVGFLRGATMNVYAGAERIV